MLRTRDDIRSAAATLILALVPLTSPTDSQGREPLQVTPTTLLLDSVSFDGQPVKVTGRIAKALPSNSLRLLLVRHGIAEQDSLTWRGVAEARAAGKVLKQQKIVAVVASPAKRTQQTAAIIAQELGRPVDVAEDDAFMVKPGESVGQATVRALVAVRALAERYAGESVVVVTHFDVCAALLRHAARNPEAAPCPRPRLGAPSITEITVLPDGELAPARLLSSHF